METASQPTRSPDGQVTLTRQEASELLGLSQSTLDTKTKAGEIGACRSGRRVYYLWRHIEEFQARCEREQAAHVQELKALRRKRTGRAQAFA